jgi:EAL domain-containing protein (putative c-di-GMP-specific phosphodiesterase class I)
MRWNHPTKGVQAPNTFLKVLEQSGDIKWVGEWGVDTMIRIHKQLKDKYPTIPLKFSLNLSTKQLLNPELANSFIALMNKHNARPDNFMLEISEFQMVEKLATIKTNIYKLRDFGFKIAVDAFDLDGQSVQTITRSPMDVIKLGRSFLRDIDNNFMKEKLLQILIKYSIDNSKMLISEGIETAVVAKYVKNQTIRYGQGYYFAKPMSYEAFEEYIERREYKRLLDEVTKLEETDEFHTIQNDAEDSYEESPDELLNRIVREKQQQS